MLYTIGQVSKMFDLPISTIRYYDKEGLFPELERPLAFVNLESKKQKRYE